MTFPGPSGVLSVVVALAKAFASPLFRLLLGPPQERAIRAAYRRAVNRALSGLPPSLGNHIRKGMKRRPARREMVKVLDGGSSKPDLEIIKDELRRAGLVIEQLQIPISAIVDEIQEGFLEELKGEPNTQVALTGSLVEAIHGLLSDQGSGPARALPPGRLASSAARLRDVVSSRLQWHRRLHNLPNAEVRLRVRLGRGAAVGEGGVSENRVVDATSLASLQREERICILKAPAGAGKSTILLQVSESLLEAVEGPIPVFLTLADWSPNDQDLVEYACDELQGSRPEIESLAESGKLFWILDGWNEVGLSGLDSAAAALRKLVRRHVSAGLVISTRINEASPPVGPAETAVPLALIPRERRRIVESHGMSHQDALIETIESSPELEELTRTPLFLTAAIEVARGGQELPADPYGLLAGFVARSEQDPHREALRSQCRGQHRRYLTEIAAELLTRGTTRMSWDDALVVVASTTRKLQERGLLGDPPDAAAVLRSLVDHHLLLGGSGHRRTIGFIHPRFQEWFGSEYLAHLVPNQLADPGMIQAEICDRVPWGESLGFLMDRWGSERKHELAEGLLRLALPVDLSFSMELAARAAPVVWETLSPEVVPVIRRFHQSTSAAVADYGANLMAASQMATFSEDVWRALRSEDDQTRFQMHDRLARFGLGVLGEDWPEKAGELPGGAAEFIRLAGGRASPHIAREIVSPFFADSDRAVRASAIETLIWVGYTDEAVVWIVNSEPEILLEGRVLEDLELLPQEDLEQLRIWLGIASERLGSDAPLALHVLMARLSEEGALEAVKQELDSNPVERRSSAVLEVLRDLDPRWLSDWIVRNLPSELGWDLDWGEYLGDMPEPLAERLVLSAIADEEPRPETTRLVGLAERFRSAETAATLGRIFAARWNAGGHPEHHTEESRLDEALAAVSTETRIRAILNSEVVADTPHAILLLIRSLTTGVHQEDAELSPELRRDLRSAVDSWMKILEESDEPRGDVRARLAGLIGVSGEDEDAEALLHLIQLDRADAEREEAETGRRRAISYRNLHVGALVKLGSGAATDALRDMLHDREYFGEAARALAELPRASRRQETFPPRFWKRAAKAREKTRPQVPSHPDATLIAEALVAHLDARGDEPGAPPFAYDLGTATIALAQLDASAALELIPRLVQLDGIEFGLEGALQAILADGGEVSGSIAGQVFDKLLNRLDRWGPAIQDEEMHSLVEGLAVLLLSSEPSLGVQRCGELEPRLRRSYQFRTLLRVLGCCEDPSTFEYLSQLAESDGLSDRWKAELIAAIASHRSKAAEDWIVTHVESLGNVEGPYAGVILMAVRNRASRSEGFRRRLLDLAQPEIGSAPRRLLEEVLRDIEGEDVAVAAAYLLDDQDGGPSYLLQKKLEKAFFRREDAGFGGAYTLTPKSNNSLRGLLYDLVISQAGRQKSAATVLINLENERLDRGRPYDEPRHPNWPMQPPGGGPWQRVALEQ